jgi:membrane dipeptidase
MRSSIALIINAIMVAIIIASCNAEKRNDEKDLLQKSRDLCQSVLILDSHIDWPNKHLTNSEDISIYKNNAAFDYERAIQGGLNSVLSVAYIPSELNISEARLRFDTLVNLITNYSIDYPQKFALATNPYEIKRNFSNGVFSLPICLENGSPIGDSLKYLSYLKSKGIAYITLCHMKSNQICDANFDSNRKWNGLSPFGKDVIKEMNKLGIMVDVSHSTDSTVFQVLKISNAPIVATHSSCRHFTPGFERNLSDTLIKSIAAKGGVIMLNIASYHLDAECLKNWVYLYYNWQDSTGIDLESIKGNEFLIEYGKKHKLTTDVKKLVDHVDHIVKIVGINHIGLGSDFDGVIKQSLPKDLQDVSCYPIIVAELLSRGYEENDIKKILSENFLRVWDAVIEFGEINNL